jgi:hypothetical protein
MLKHEVGIKKIPQALFEVDDSYLRSRKQNLRSNQASRRSV